MRKISAVIAISILSGCATDAEIAYYRQQAEEQSQREKAAYRERLAESCDAIGFRRGTDAHAQCILSQHQHRQSQILQAIIGSQPVTFLPSCSSLPAGTAGYARAQGQCR